ncbi:hypothetical protein DSY14_02445 [Nocardiopsis sp. MG754419]|nr:hypothetical protein [Nocardiopsis sp. MG754419]
MVLLGVLPLLVVVRMTSFGGLDQTALFYLGLPVALALLVVLLARPRSAVGVAMAVTTLLLLLSGPLLGEGVVCLLISAPLIYGVVALVAWMFVRILGRDGRGPHAYVAVPVLFVLLLEGVGGISPLPREDTGTGTVVVAATPTDVADALAAPPAYGAPEALFLRAIPFPRPVEAHGAGLAEGDTRAVRFTPRRSLGPGAVPTPRHMELTVVDSRIHADGGRVVFDVTDDTTFDRWMEMERAVVTWTATPEGTEMTWEIDHRRTYDPSWYFGPVQSYATDLAAAYLADTFARAAR